MSFQTQTIKYGWVALASLGVITGTTIYVLNNTRQQVKPEDIIEIALGTYERTLALQTGTNSLGEPTYPAGLNPTYFVRTWTSNVYTTNGVTVYTNIVTNTIGWHPDRIMLATDDAIMKALIPYYVDESTVYDGTTNIVMLTVTGLWASLQIGDKTNQFTRTPAWTNPVSTNWIVNYTSYWPSTNGTATNINYTSDYRQVVNYAQSWTATGGHVWVTSSNWASEVVTVTNAATFGDYPWQIYVEDLQERYKVLNALQYLPVTVSVSNEYKYGEGSTNGGWLDFGGIPYTTMVATAMDNWEKAKQMCDAMASTNVLMSYGNTAEDKSGGWISEYHYSLLYFTTSARAQKTIWTKLFVSFVNNGTFGGGLDYYIKATDPYRYTLPGEMAWSSPIEFDPNGTPAVIPSQYYRIASFIVDASNTASFYASVCEDANWVTNIAINGQGAAMRGFSVWQSYPYPDSGNLVLFKPQFNYCTNKYW